MSRTDTAAGIELFLQNGDVPYHHYEIDYFDEGQAHEFIDKKLDTLSPRSRPHRHWRQPFMQARATLFGFTYRALGLHDDRPWDRPTVRSFLGYAPVLEAMSSFLHHHSNYMALKEDIEQIFAGRGVTFPEPQRILIVIAEDLLHREKEKFRQNLPVNLQQAANTIGWNEFDRLYEVDEQKKRLLQRNFPGLEDAPIGLSLPPQIQSAYEESLDMWFMEHPFVGQVDGFANVVFRDYLLAWQIALQEETLLHYAIREFLMQPNQLPPPLFGIFLLAMSTKDDTAVLHGEDVGTLYESLIAASGTPENCYLDVFGDGTSGDIRGVLQAPGIGEAQFSVLQGEKTLQFGRRIMNSVVSNVPEVHLGQGSGVVRIGPDVDIECDTLRIGAAEMSVEAGKNGNVIVTANAYIELGGSTPRLKVYADNGSLVGFSWPNMRYPWVGYQVPQGEVETLDRRVGEAFRAFCQIFKWFRRYGYDRLARSVRLLENPAIAGTGLANDILRFLISEGIIERQGSLYSVESKTLGRLRINWTDIKARRISNEVTNLLERFYSQKDASP